MSWIIDQPGVSVGIPGARPATHARANAEAADVPPLDTATLSAFETLYDVRGYLHDRW